MNSVTITMPWSGFFSKNARTQYNGKSRYTAPEVRKIHDSIITLLQEAGGEWYQGKVWLDIHVALPHKKSDAINVLDTVADAVKKGIGIDDRWFAVKGLDWELVKDNPTITITVSQDVERNMRYCSKCQELYELTEENFSRNKSMFLGFGPSCKPCVNAYARERGLNLSANRKRK